MSASDAVALGVSLGGISVSVGGNSGGGLGVNASVGGSNGINANASVGGGSGLGVNASVGGSTGINANVSAAPGSGLGVDASVGGSTGLNVGVSVGQDGITASVSGGSSSGSSGGSSSGSTPSGTVTYTMPDAREVIQARQQICSITGNSAAFNGEVVFGSQGKPIGVIHAAWIKPDLEVEKLTFVTLASFLNPCQCVTITVKQVDVGRNGIRLPIAADALRSMIPVNRR